MKKPHLSALAAVLFLLAGQVRASDAVGIRAEIQPLLDEMMLAANAHDTDRFMVLFLHDRELVTVFNGVMTIGWDDARAIQLKAWNGGKSDVIYSRDGEERFTLLGSGGVVVTEPLTSVRKRPDGQVSKTKFVATMIWEKRPEGWRIVQAHESTAPK